MANYLFRDPDVVFIHIPKNSGSSMRALWGRAHEEQVFGAIPPRWPQVPRFAVIRAPKARFLSAVRMFKFGIAETDNYYHTPRLPALTVGEALDVVEDPEVPFDRSVRTPKGNLKHHLLAQTHPYHCLWAATHILRFESLAADYAAFAAQVGLPPELPHVRKGNAPTGQIEMTTAEEDRFAALFAQDLAQLGYDITDQPTGPMKTPAPPPPQIYDQWTPLFSSRFARSPMAEILPQPGDDLSVFGQTRLPGAPGPTWPGREPHLQPHIQKLMPEFQGSSYLALLTAACIVALRRADSESDVVHAKTLLFKCLDKVPPGDFNLRWLTSLADTLADHGRTPQERALGLAGTLLANTVKLAETERSMFHPPASWPPRRRYAPGRPLFDGVIAYGIEKGDMIDNLLARVSDQATAEPLAGAILQQIVTRLRQHDTVLARMHGLAGQPKPPVLSRWRRRLVARVVRLLG